AARVRKVAIKLYESQTGILLLVGARKRHAELQEIIGRLPSFRIALVALGKRTGRVGKSLTLVISFSQPILGVSGQGIVRVLLNKVVERLFWGGIVGLLYQTEREVVLVGGGSGGQDTRRL